MPEISLQSEVQYLKGVGPRRAAALANIGIDRVGQLIYYLPRRYLDRSMVVPIGSLQANMNVTIIGRVLGKGILKGRKSRLEVILGDDSGFIALIWFSGYRFLEKMFKKGDIFAVTGSVTYFQQRQIVHPEVERIEEDDAGLIHTGRIVPVYPSTAELKKAGVTGRLLRRIISQLLDNLERMTADYLPEKIMSDNKLIPLPKALQLIHYPEKMADVEKARRRLAFDELLELQYLILKNRFDKKVITKKHSYKKPDEKIRQFIKQLPFKLTEDQQKAGREIFDDLSSERPMHRLLHGDVGCGKTVVALLAAVYAAENNLQTVFMAPTEILAEQHFKNWSEILEKIGINSALITGSIKKAKRQNIEKAIECGEIAVAFGTHAIISKSVKFYNLGLAIIDEQQRFGVMQRSRLIGKGNFPDTLVMSATPIPRTLALTLYGDLDISSIKTMPPGRKANRTVWRTATARPEIYDYLKGRLSKGEQLFFVYPLVEKSEKLDLQAAEEEYERLKKDIFPEFKVGLIHGRVKKDKREKVITDFRNRKIDIIVATTVIEVGVDIPSATMMVIEHAERFGLSQLHQLRGRVGRGEKKGLAIALASSPISELAKKRLEMFEATIDGFEIAEADLQLRGPGEFFGTRQHGLPELRIANLSTDTDFLTPARKIVATLLSGDKELDRGGRKLLAYLSGRVEERKTLARTG